MLKLWLLPALLFASAGLHAEAASAAAPTSGGQTADAQADNHVEAVTRANCQAGKQSATVTSAAAALEREPDELPPRLRLADVLVDQGCYQEAVTVLEAGQQQHPHSSELAGKLRDMRSLVTEQTYIEGLTQAAEGAKFQRNQLRCTRLADLTACDDALKFKPDDPQLLQAKASALAAAQAQQASIAGPIAAPTTAPESIAETSGRAASPAEQKHGVSVAPTTAAANRRTRQTAAGTRSPPAPEPPVAAALIEPPSTRTYSNEAPPGQSN